MKAFCFIILLQFFLTQVFGVDPYLPAFHFTPSPENWMNDPNGPFYDPYYDKYHLFFQYKTPRTWGHAISDDLLTWNNLPIALNTDQAYDSGGVFTGSTTLVPKNTKNNKNKNSKNNQKNKNNKMKTMTDRHYNDNDNGNDNDSEPSNDIYILYSVSTNNMICLAYPTNYSNDAKLINWTKYNKNCVVNATANPNNIPDGRDPSTAWYNSTNNLWYFIYGINYNNGKGGAAQLVTISDNWNNFTVLTNNYFYNNNISGQWECPDFFKFPKTSITNVNDSNIDIYLLKASLGGTDHYAIGTIDINRINNNNNDATKLRFIPHSDNNGIISNIIDNNKLFDFGGHYYASKSFLDFKNVNNQRQIIFGWLTEERSVDANGNPYGWAGVQSLPRNIKLFYNNTNNINQYIMYTPVIDEFNKLHINSTFFNNNGKPLNVSSSSNQGGIYWFDENEISGNQLDIIINKLENRQNEECLLYILSSINKREYTTVGVSFNTNTFYVNTTQGSLNPNVTGGVSSAYVQGWENGGILDSLRVIIDHSVIEIYVNNGISCMTRRVYPTLVESIRVGIAATGDNSNCIAQSIVSYNVMTTMY